MLFLFLLILLFILLQEIYINLIFYFSNDILSLIKKEIISTCH